MELLLMRHADAVDGPGNDFARDLSETGVRQAEKMGVWLKRLDAKPDRIVSSPYPRAHQTAAMMAELLEVAAFQPDERLAPGMNAETGSALVHEFGARDGRLLLVGHAPDLALLASYLIGADNEAVAMRKGAVACLDTERTGFGGSTIKWLIHPKLM